MLFDIYYIINYTVVNTKSFYLLFKSNKNNKSKSLLNVFEFFIPLQRKTKKKFDKTY